MLNFFIEKVGQRSGFINLYKQFDVVYFALSKYAIQNKI